MFAKQMLRFVVAELGMGESVEDRAGMLVALHIKPATRSVPINALVPVEGTPMKKPVEIWEMIRMVAATKL
jgi:biotin synthase